MLFDFEELSKQLDEYQSEVDDVQRKQRKELFFLITGEWDTEGDIDYSLSISTLKDILVESPQYIQEVIEGKEKLGIISDKMDKLSYALKVPRLL